MAIKRSACSAANEKNRVLWFGSKLIKGKHSTKVQSSAKLEQRCGGMTNPPNKGFSFQLVKGHNGVDQPHLKGLLGIIHTSQEPHFPSTLLTYAHRSPCLTSFAVHVACSRKQSAVENSLAAVIQAGDRVGSHRIAQSRSMIHKPTSNKICCYSAADSDLLLLLSWHCFFA